MSNSDEQEQLHEKTISQGEKQKELIIDLSKLTDSQQLLLVLTGISFVIQILFLIDIKLFTDFFKGFVATQYNLMGLYIATFMNTLVPYLFILFFFVMIYLGFKILENEQKSLETFIEIFNYVSLGLMTLIVMFIIAIYSIPSNPINEVYPTLVELLLFLIVLFVSIFIVFLPFGLFKFYGSKDSQPAETRS